MSETAQINAVTPQQYVSVALMLAQVTPNGVISAGQVAYRALNRAAGHLGNIDMEADSALQASGLFVRASFINGGRFGEITLWRLKAPHQPKTFSQIVEASVASCVRQLAHSRTRAASTALIERHVRSVFRKDGEHAPSKGLLVPVMEAVRERLDEELSTQLVCAEAGAR